MLINVIGTVELIERQERGVLCISEVAVVTKFSVVLPFMFTVWKGLA